MDTTLFRKAKIGNLLIAQIYVDDIIFGATTERMCKEFPELMKGEFEMSMMGELKFFLGLQNIQKDDGIFIHQENTKNLFKRFRMDEARPMATPMHPSTIIDKD